MLIHYLQCLCKYYLLELQAGKVCSLMLHTCGNLCSPDTEPIVHKAPHYIVSSNEKLWKTRNTFGIVRVNLIRQVEYRNKVCAVLKWKFTPITGYEGPEGV
jgi:hypothetical protein